MTSATGSTTELPPSVTATRDAAVEGQYSDEDRAVLLRFVTLAPEAEFRMAAVETRTPADRRALLAWLARRAPERHIHELSLRSLAGSSVHLELRDALAALTPRPRGLVLVLTDLEEMQGGLSSETPRLFAQLNVQRDLLVRDVPVPILLCSTPYALLRLRTVAPDFCDYFRTLVRVADAVPSTTLMALRSSFELEVEVGASEAGRPVLLRDATKATDRWELDHALDLLAQFLLTDDAEAWRLEADLLRAEITHRREGWEAGRAAYERLQTSDARNRRPATEARISMGRSRYALTSGRFDEAERLWREADALLGVAGDAAGQILLAITRSRADLLRGLPAEARTYAEQALGRAIELSLSPLTLSALSALVDIDLSSGDYMRAEDLIRSWALPLAAQIGDSRSRATVLWRLAQVLVQRGSYDEALRMLRDDVLPAYDPKHHAQARARTLGEIANVLQYRGQLSEALRIWREEELPVYERYADEYARTATLGKIAGVLAARGAFEDSLHIRRNEELPYYVRSGRVREAAQTTYYIAETLLAQNRPRDAADLIRRDVLPVVQRLGDSTGLAFALALLGSCEAKLGRTAEALRLCTHARDLADRIGRPDQQLTTRLRLADTLWRVGNPYGALRELHFAMDRALLHEEPVFVLRVASNLIPALVAEGRVDEARHALARARAFLSEHAHHDLIPRLEALEAQLRDARPLNRAERRKRRARHR